MFRWPWKSKAYYSKLIGNLYDEWHKDTLRLRAENASSSKQVCELNEDLDKMRGILKTVYDMLDKANKQLEDAQDSYAEQVPDVLVDAFRRVRI